MSADSTWYQAKIKDAKVLNIQGANITGNSIYFRTYEAGNERRIVAYTGSTWQFRHLSMEEAATCLQAVRQSGRLVPAENSRKIEEQYQYYFNY
jgi:hypothetical protein